MDIDRSAVSFDIQVEEAASRAKELLEAVAQGGGQYGDVFFEHLEETTLQVEASSIRSAPKGMRHRITAGLGIRAFDPSGNHLASIDGFEPARWREAAAFVAGRLEGKGFAPVIFETLELADTLPADAPHLTTQGEKEALLDLLLEAAFSYDSGLARCTIAYRDATRQTFLANTAGQAVVNARARIGLRIGVSFEADVRERAYGVRGYSGSLGAVVFGKAVLGDAPDDPAHFVREVIDQARRMREAVPLEAGMMPVVFSGGWAGIWLHETLGHVLEADVVPERLSEGDQIGVAGLTVFDDPRLDGRQGSYNRDDEGVPAQTTMLIENGRVANLLTDRFYAHRMGVSQTGNGRRARYSDVPLPRMSNLCLAPGQMTPEEIIGRVDRGLFVKQAAAGVHHRVDQTGDSQFEVQVIEGYLIEKGELMQPVAGITVSGSCMQALQNLSAIGNDVQPDHGGGICEKAGQIIPVSVNTPTVLIDKLVIGQ